MNSNSSLNVILIKIQENAHLFENNKDIAHLVSVLCKLGNLVIQKNLSCSLLKNVLLALKRLRENYMINNDEYKYFLKHVNIFYKSSNLCETYKLGILSCFSPAVEVELMSLLRLCLNVNDVTELQNIRTTIKNSILLQACLKNEKNIKKVVGILKNAFILSEGNPVVAYLTFNLCNLIEESFHHPCIISKELNYLHSFFHFPYHLLKEDEQKLLIKKMITACFETTNMNLCTKNDLILYTAIYPMWYYKMLNLCIKQNSNYILEFMKFLCVSGNSEFLDWPNDIKSAHQNSIWKELMY